MFSSWKQLIYCTLQAQAYKEAKYVAAGSTCEVITVLEMEPDEQNEVPLPYPIKMEVGLFNHISKGKDGVPFIKASFVLPGGVPDSEALDYRAIFNTEHRVYHMQPVSRQLSEKPFDLSNVEWKGYRRSNSSTRKTRRIRHGEHSVSPIPVAAPAPVVALPIQHTGETQEVTQVAEAPQHQISQVSTEQTATLLAPAGASSTNSDDHLDWAEESEENGTYVPMSSRVTQSQASSSTSSDWSSNSEARSVSGSSTPDPPASLEFGKTSAVSEDGAEEIAGLVDASPSMYNEHFSTPRDTIISGSPSGWLETREHHRQAINEHVASLDYDVNTPGDLSGYFDRLTSRWKATAVSTSDSLLSTLEIRECSDGTLQGYKAGYFDHSWHHLNYYDIPIYHKSFTTPEVSLWMAHQNYNKGQFNRLTRQKVLASQAGKYIDRVRYSGPSNILSLHGTALRDAVTGYVDVAYRPVGKWQFDLYSSDESIPVYSDPCDTYRHQAFDRHGDEILTFGPVGGYVINECDGDSVVNDDGRLPPVTLSRNRVATKEKSSLRMVCNVDDDLEEKSEQMLLQEEIESRIPLQSAVHLMENGNGIRDPIPTRPSSPKAFSFDRDYQGPTVALASTTIIEESADDIDADDAYFYGDPDETTESQAKETVDSAGDRSLILEDDNTDALSNASTEHEEDPSSIGADVALSTGPTHYILSQDVNQRPVHHDASATSLFHTETPTGDIQLPLAYVEGKVHEAQIPSEDSFNDGDSAEEFTIEDRIADEDIVPDYPGDEQQAEQYAIEGDALKHMQAQEKSNEEDRSADTEVNSVASLQKDEDLDGLSDGSTEHGEEPLLAGANSSIFKKTRQYILSQDLADTIEHGGEPPAQSTPNMIHRHSDISSGGLELPVESVEADSYMVETNVDEIDDYDIMKEDMIEHGALKEGSIQLDEPNGERKSIEGDALQTSTAQEMFSEKVNGEGSDKPLGADQEDDPKALNADNTDINAMTTEGILHSNNLGDTVHEFVPSDRVTEEDIVLDSAFDERQEELHAVDNAGDTSYQLAPTALALPEDSDERDLQPEEIVERQDTPDVQKHSQAAKVKVFQARVGLGKNYWQDQPLRCLLHQTNAVTSTANTPTDENDTLPLLSSFVSHKLPFVEYNDVSEIPQRQNSNDSIIKKSTVSIGRMARKVVRKCSLKGWKW
ncbi:MAG: hypothetical protein Q9187_002156 [Circinaria calcarea]